MPSPPPLPRMQVHFNIPIGSKMLNVSVSEAEALRDTINEYLEDYRQQHAAVTAENTPDLDES